MLSDVQYITWLIIVLYGDCNLHTSQHLWTRLHLLQKWTALLNLEKGIIKLPRPPLTKVTLDAVVLGTGEGYFGRWIRRKEDLVAVIWSSIHYLDIPCGCHYKSRAHAHSLFTSVYVVPHNENSWSPISWSRCEEKTFPFGFSYKG